MSVTFRGKASPPDQWPLPVMRTLILRSRLFRIGSAMPHRNFFKKSREEGLAEEAAQLRAIAGMLPPGAVRDATLRCARGAETGLRLDDWLKSSGLNPPT
jgi:hypothetical protein